MVHLLKDVISRSQNNKDAYRLVYQILSEGAQTFQAIVRRGLEIHAVDGPPEAGSSTAAGTIAAASDATTSNAASQSDFRARLARVQDQQSTAERRRERAAAPTAQRRQITETHPFHSTS